MASFLERLLGRREPSSAEVARERLKLVLVTDRSDLTPDKLEEMQGEIIQVIRRYLQIDEQQVHIKLEQRERKNYLVADIPLARDHGPYIPEELRRPPEPAPEPADSVDQPEPAPEMAANEEQPEPASEPAVDADKEEPSDEGDDTQPKKPAASGPESA
jgi:cell division topological specificity factor